MLFWVLAVAQFGELPVWRRAIWFKVVKLLTRVARLIAFCPLMIVVELGLLLLLLKSKRLTVIVRCCG